MEFPPRLRILPFCHKNARSSPFAAWLCPTTWPRSFIDQAVVPLPPSVPRPITRPLSHRNAFTLCAAWTTIWPRSFNAIALPLTPRSRTTHRACPDPADLGSPRHGQERQTEATT